MLSHREVMGGTAAPLAIKLTQLEGGACVLGASIARIVADAPSFAAFLCAVARECREEEDSRADAPMHDRVGSLCVSLLQAACACRVDIPRDSSRHLIAGCLRSPCTPPQLPGPWVLVACGP